MAQAIDPEWLGERLRGVRKDRELTLQEVSDQTGISVPTLSRIERATAKTLNSDTLVTLSEWIGMQVEMLKTSRPAVVRGGKPIESVPDIVELHLRADKGLDRKTATALANLFRSVYEQVAEQMRSKTKG